MKTSHARILAHLIDVVWKATPKVRDHSHVEISQWIDHAPVNGTIKTTCRICGETIGYRPVGKTYWKQIHTNRK